MRLNFVNIVIRWLIDIKFLQIEVTVARKELRKKASEFVEQEAELSESEWGSADEDEKDLDMYDGDLVNDEEFDQNKIQSELERIRM